MLHLSSLASALARASMDLSTSFTSCSVEYFSISLKDNERRKKKELGGKNEEREPCVEIMKGDMATPRRRVAA